MLVSPLIILPLSNVHFINPRVEQEAGRLLLTNAGRNPIQGTPSITRGVQLGLKSEAWDFLGPQEETLPHSHTLSPGLYRAW